MRYVPSPDQIAYLDRIGVKDFCSGAPLHRRAAPSLSAPKKAPTAFRQVHAFVPMVAPSPLKVSSPARSTRGIDHWLMRILRNLI